VCAHIQVKLIVGGLGHLAFQAMGATCMFDAALKETTVLAKVRRGLWKHACGRFCGPRLSIGACITC